MSTEYRGILFIGDPHFASNVVSFRKDDYPRTILGKFRWCLDHAASERLLPAVLGDLFNVPRDNANWLLGELIELLAHREVIAIHGNHDCYEGRLGEDDSLDVLRRAACLRLLDRGSPWHGAVAGRDVIIGGSCWGQPLPDCFEGRPPGGLVFWITHHDLHVPGYEEGRLPRGEISGIDAVINGHIHRRLEDVIAGQTVWMTPGNISRVARSDASRAHEPSALAIGIDATGWHPRRIAVPHEAYDDVFHAMAQTPEVEVRSGFVTGLAELQARRTAEGVGLEFLQQNVTGFARKCRARIWRLANEVMNHGQG